MHVGALPDQSSSRHDPWAHVAMNALLQTIHGLDGNEVRDMTTTLKAILKYPLVRRDRSKAEREVKRRPEFEQALLRVVIAFIVMVYLFCYTFYDANVSSSEIQVLAVSVGFFLFGLILAARVLTKGGTSVARRYLGMIADNAVTTYCLMNMGEGGAVVIGVYLFVSFGNGFRYGRRYLHTCQAMGVVGFSCVLAFSEFWSQHIAIGLGFLIGLVVLPFYVGVLAQRLERAKLRADEANQAKGRFVANVSHEMRTPLNGVIAMADVLRETSLSESQREIVETMTTSAELLLAQIEDVLDLSKIEANKVQIESHPMDLGRLLSSTVKVVLPQARYKGLPINTEIADDAAGWFIGDSHHLRQVVLNLLSNAVKFTERGSVTLRATSAGYVGERKLIRIEVQDTGIGIAENKQDAIFEPFAQADDSTTRIYGGTGLGTTIARQLVGLMGGKIGLRSQPNVGSLFWIELALVPTTPGQIDLTSQPPATAVVGHSQALAAARAGKVHKLHGARILVAEDNPTNQRVAQLILESAGHSVIIVENGEAALDALESASFDVALFDLSMPLVSGLEALKLYRFSAAKPVPVLILSANVTPETIAECHRAGAAEFVPKPLRASHLIEAIERHLSQHAKSSVQTPVVPRTEERPALEVIDSPSVDKAVIEDLARLSSDPTFVVRLIDGFYSDADRLVDEIVNAISSRRYELVKDSAHALKGGAASVGASQLVQFAKRIERASHDSLRLKAAQWIEELKLLDRQARLALNEHVRPYRDQQASPISGT
jgi:two-component system, sensor histidine kinase RpfC